MSEKQWSLDGWQGVADGVWRQVCHVDDVPGGVNVVLVAGTHGCLLVDAGATPEQGAALRESVAEVTTVPLTAVVLTHDHWDHVDGLPAFADVPVLGHTSLGERVTEPFSLVTVRDLGGGVTAEALAVGPAHTKGDVVVNVPHAKILVAGDLVEESGHPSVGDGSTLRGWGRAFSVIGPLLIEGYRAIPGHGAVVEREYVAAQAGELSGILAQCEMLLDRGVDDVDRAIPLGTWPWEEGDALRGAVASAFKDLRAAGKRPQLGLTSSS